MIKRLLLPVVMFSLAASGLAASAGAASAASGWMPETITAGYAHTCALDVAGKAWCWGRDNDGRVGDGAASQADKQAPVPVAGSRAFSTITAGSEHTCALDTAGRAWCWGYNGANQVGDGSGRVPRYAPVGVAGGRVFTAISAGGRHTCALDATGRAWCWGYDFYGQAGDGSADASWLEPVGVAGGRTFTAISAGEEHTCALEAAGKAWCWGYDGAGQVGDGGASQSEKYSPVRVAGGRAFTAITAGGWHTCALDAVGKAWCWGYDLGVGDGGASQSDKYSPVQVAGGGAFGTITGGYFHTCAVDLAGNAWCWGYDGEGGVGDGGASQAIKYAPTAVRMPVDYDTGSPIAMRAIAAGGFHTCALDAASKAWCWGNDTHGQVGNGSLSKANQYSPVKVSGGRVWRLP